MGYLEKIKKYKKVRFFLLKTKKYKRKNPVSFWSIVITLSVSLFFVLIYSINFTELSDDPAVWGTFGDYIGGIVGTVIAFLVFIATREIINLQKQELKETREELKKSRNAQELQATLLQQQYFDNTFFSWLKRLKEQVDLSDEKIQLTANGISKTEEVGTKFYPILSRMYNNLNKSTLDNENKKEYSNIIRSYLTPKVLKFILIDDCDKEIKNIIKQYALLKNLEHNTRYCEKEYEKYFLNYKISAFEGHRMFMPYRISLEKNPEELAKYAEYPDIKVRQKVAANKNTPENVLDKLATNDKSNEVRISALGNSHISTQILEKELQNKYNEINDNNIKEIIYIIFNNSQIYDDNTKFNQYAIKIIEYLADKSDKKEDDKQQILYRYFDKEEHKNIFKKFVILSIDNILNNKYQLVCYYILEYFDDHSIKIITNNIENIKNIKKIMFKEFNEIDRLSKQPQRDECKTKITSVFKEHETELREFISQLETSKN